VGVESAVTALTERVAELERDNRRLRGTASVGSQRVDRVQRGMSQSDLSEDPSSDHKPPLPDVSPFLSSDDDTTERSPIIPHHRVMILAHGQPIPHGGP
nr:hypothetical protein [Tanacetum cinerariifolium]